MPSNIKEDPCRGQVKLPLPLVFLRNVEKLHLVCLLYIQTSFLIPRHFKGNHSAVMGQEGFLKNSRVYILTSVAYMGSLLFGMSHRSSAMIDSKQN